MTAVQSKASSRKDLVWMVTSIVDRYRAKIWTGPEHTSIEALSGRGSGGRGALDLFLFKAQLKDRVLSSWLEGLRLSAENKVKIRQALDSHESYREKLRPYQDAADKVAMELSWTSSFGPDEQKLLAFIEERARPLVLLSSPRVVAFSMACCTSCHAS